MFCGSSQDIPSNSKSSIKVIIDGQAVEPLDEVPGTIICETLDSTAITIGHNVDDIMNTGKRDDLTNSGKQGHNSSLQLNYISH